MYKHEILTKEEISKIIDVKLILDKIENDQRYEMLKSEMEKRGAIFDDVLDKLSSIYQSIGCIEQAAIAWEGLPEKTRKIVLKIADKERKIEYRKRDPRPFVLLLDASKSEIACLTYLQKMGFCEIKNLTYYLTNEVKTGIELTEKGASLVNWVIMYYEFCSKTNEKGE